MIKSHYLQSAFKRCCLTLLFLSSLTSFNARSSDFTLSPDFTVDGLSYRMLSMDDLTCEVAFWDGRGDTNVTIPAIVTYKGRDISVIKIGMYAFSNSRLTSITLPSSINEIGEFAFNHCMSLIKANLSDELIEIGRYAFQNCDNLKEIVLPSKVKIIEEKAFEGCSNLKTLLGGAALERIGDYAFNDCTLLHGVINFKNITRIGIGAFNRCQFLTEVIIPSTATNIGEKCFYGSTLNTLKIEDGESSINIQTGQIFSGKNYYTASLKQLYIGREITVIGKVDNINACSPFDIEWGGILELGKYVNKLNRNCINEWYKIGFLISHNLTPPSIPEMSNSGYVNIEVRVPAGALEAYKQSPVWKNFWNIKAIEDESGISDIERDDDDSFQVYDTAGILVDASCTSEKLQQLPHGVYIVVKHDKRMKIKI